MSGYRDNCGLLYLDMKTVDEKDDPLHAVSPNIRLQRHNLLRKERPQRLSCGKSAQALDRGL